MYINNKKGNIEKHQRYYRTSEEWRKYKNATRETFMTEDEMTKINFYIDELNNNRGQMQELFADWERYEKAYKGEQELVDNRPNTRVNITNANVEGQIASMIDQNLSINTIPQSPNDAKYAEWARIGLNWTIRKNKIKNLLSNHERRRLKFGSAFFKVYFDPNFANGFGLVRICTPPINKIFIDNAIKDVDRLEDATYIAETINYSQDKIIEVYGKEKALALDYGNNEYYDNGIFKEDRTSDDEYTTTVIQRWSKNGGVLRLEEFSACGVLLYDSHKEGDRKSNQKNKKIDIVPYYEYVDNKYPYFMTTLYPVEGQLYGFGDIKLLEPIQTLINDLYDKIRIAARPDLLLIDTNAEIDVEDFDESSFDPRPFNGAIQGQPIYSVPWGRVNANWWQLLESAHAEAQKVTRFSDLMLGQGRSSDSATEAAIQQQQGSSATNQKKSALTETFTCVLEYVLGLSMELYTEGKAFRLSDKEDDYEWIDFRQLATVPIKKPVTQGYIREFREANPESDIPKWMLLEDENGTPLSKNVDLDIEVSIGAGLPKNQTFLWQMVQQLAGITSFDLKTQQPKPLLDWNETRRFMKDFLHIPLEEKEEDGMREQLNQQQMLEQQMQQGQPQQGIMQQGQLPNADVQGLSAGGNPMMSVPNNAK